MNRCVKKILLSGMTFGLISTVGYCGMFNRNYEENFYLDIPKQERLNYTFEEKIIINKKDYYGFFLALHFDNKEQRKRIHNYFLEKRQSFDVNLNIYDVNNNLVNSVTKKAILSSTDSEARYIELHRLVLDDGEYLVRVKIEDIKPYQFLDIKTFFHISNGHRPK